MTSTILEYVLLTALIVFVAFKVFAPVGQQLHHQLQQAGATLEELSR